MTTKLESLSHHANIVLAIHSENIEIYNIKSKLARFYNVDEANVIVSSSETIAVFFIGIKDEAFGIDWYY